MKVLHVFNELMASGAEVRFCTSAPCWRDAGIEAEVLSTGEEIGPFALNMKEAGYPVHHIPFRKSPFFFLSFYRLLRRHKYDVVHVHCERANFYYGLAARMAGARVVRTICATFAFKGFLALRRNIQRNLLRLLGCTQVSVGPSVQETERRYLHNRTVLITNWYDTRRFVPPSRAQRHQARQCYGIPGETFTIVSIGNCEAVKNHGELLKALAKIAADLDFVYLHAGQEEEGKPERQLAEELGILDRVRFLGYTQDVLTPLYAADVYAMPSLREGFGVAVLEAMGAGVPVILAEVSGLKDLKPIEGICWAKPKADSLAEALKRIARMPFNERLAIGRQTHEKIRNLYGIERAVRAYVDIYREGGQE